MADKKEWKARAKQQQRIADELFDQVQKLGGELAAVDQILTETQLPGPTIGAWAQQVRNLFARLIDERGIVGGTLVPALGIEQVIEGEQQSSVAPKMHDTGEYVMIDDNT